MFNRRTLVFPFVGIVVFLSLVLGACGSQVANFPKSTPEPTATEIPNNVDDPIIVPPHFTRDWTKTFSTIPDSKNWAAEVAIDEAGNIYVVGSTSNGQNQDIWVAKYDSQGNLLWEDIFDIHK